MSLSFGTHGVHQFAFTIILLLAILNFTKAEKPKLQPLHFPQSRIRVGESASALCALVAGSPVVRFKWFKENVAIDGKLPYVNVKNDKRVSVLTIESVTLSSAGNYTCIADNDYGSDANSAALVVEAPPQWKTEPRDLSVSAGQALLVECSATGYPLPKVTWKKEEPKNERTLVASQDGSATLSVTESTKETEGRYFCEADNGVGAALKTALFIKVKQAPKIQPFTFNDKVRIGGRAVGSCIVVTAAAPLTFTWIKDGVQLRDKTGLSIQNNRLVSLLIIETADVSSHGNYTCRASNAMGTDAYTAELKVEAPPTWSHEPQDVSAIVGTNVTVECRATGSPIPQITWTKSKDGTSTRLLMHKDVLLIQNIQDVDAGSYTCKAENGVGPTLHKTVRVNIRGRHSLHSSDLRAKQSTTNLSSAYENDQKGYLQNPDA
ncbi:Down syndrome cell adhesion molecule-like protein Dscam2 [Ixodes scapularis]|uniref:Down syndrome cell adhesion molecule-like protein Dscam2 n=1 Tax=Ixodes scapularis TaxID=6945 RepID=UPI001C38F943|nr:Down syndrome cell adhesion molecule-like protein Dscam2 [Ixodes scapularis]